jgi:hypothetical protein
MQQFVVVTVLPAGHFNTTSHCDQVPALLIQEFPDSVIDGHVLEGVQNFRYLGALKNSQNVISEEIKWKDCLMQQMFLESRTDI